MDKTNESGNVDADIVKCKNHAFPSYLLCVEPNTLNYGEIYNFKAEMVNSDANSGIQVYVGQNISVSCVLNPLKGIRLITSFRISCTKSSNCHTCLVFELFDKFHSDLVELSGRMIATNNLGVFREFKITRGIVFVYLFDINGMVSQWKQVVELSMYNATRKEIDELFAKIEYMIEGNEMELALKKASLVSGPLRPWIRQDFYS